jgi:hypothetical protein
MRLLLLSIWASAVISSAAASPFDAPSHLLIPRAATVTISPDNSCGLTSAGNYSCDATTNGVCCSGSGWCGNTTDYCGTDCQTGFGTCDPASATTDDDSSYLCGPTNANSTCGSGLCCSASGYCGSTSDYCGDGCLSAYGTCNATAVADVPDYLCGLANGNNTCGATSCCSVNGYCGITSDYCGTGCQPGYGSCNATAVAAANPAAPVPTGVVITTDGSCGASNGNMTCDSGECCSIEGWCGTGAGKLSDFDIDLKF